MDSLFSFFSQKRPNNERAESRPGGAVGGEDDEEPTTTEYYSGASDDSCSSDLEASFKDTTPETATQFSLELETRRSSMLQLRAPAVTQENSVCSRTRSSLN